MLFRDYGQPVNGSHLSRRSLHLPKPIELDFRCLLRIISPCRLALVPADLAPTRNTLFRLLTQYNPRERFWGICPCADPLCQSSPTVSVLLPAESQWNSG